MKLFYFINEKTGDKAFFVNNELEFYFTKFSGNKKSLMYLFFITAYRIPLLSTGNYLIEDNFLITNFFKFPLKWMIDFISPFYKIATVNYKFISNSVEGQKKDRKSYFCTECEQVLFSKTKNIFKSEYFINEDRIEEIKVNRKNQIIKITCSEYS